MSDPRPAQSDLDELWRRLKDAKLRLDLAHNYVREITEDLKDGAVPEPDGYLAYRHVLRAEDLAAQNYLSILNRYQAVVLGGQARDGADRDSG